MRFTYRLTPLLLLLFALPITGRAQDVSATCSAVNSKPKAYENKAVTLRGRLMGGTMAGGKHTWQFLCVDSEGNLTPTAGGFAADGTGLPGDLYNTSLNIPVKVLGRVRGTQELPINVGSSRRIAVVPFLIEVKVGTSK